MVERLPLVAPGLTVMPPLSLRAIAGAAFTVSVNCVFAVIVAMVESVPVTVMLYVPALVVAVVVTVTLFTVPCAEFTVTGPPAEQVGGLVGLLMLVVTAHVRFTMPMYPLVPLTVIATALLVPPAVRVMGPLLLRAIPALAGTAVSVTLKLVEAVIFPV
jgi:hypothetical protein